MLLIVVLYFLAVWVFSIYLLHPWKKVKQFIIINILLILSYVVLIIYGEENIWGKDPYGLGMFFRLISAVVSHITLVFVFSIYKSFKLKNEKST